MLLSCARESHNKYDGNAIKIVALSILLLEKNIRDQIVRTNPTMTVRNVAGKDVGRMPANLAKIISPFKDSEKIGNMKAVYIGKMHHGFHKVLGDGPKLIVFILLKSYALVLMKKY